MRAPLKAPEPRSREQIEADVRADLKSHFPKRRLCDPTSDLVHWIEVYQRRVWTPEAIRAARRDPVFRDYQFDFGTTRPPKPWMLAARTFAALMLGAGVRGLGRANGPLISFVHQQLIRLMGEHAAPSPATIRSTFRQQAKPSAQQRADRA
jgi:hypothetical protein